MYRLFSGGRAVPPHIRWASKARGSLTLSEERDESRKRIVRVARLTGATEKVPPLYDAEIVEIGGWIVIVGIERLNAGPLQDEHQLGQTWWCQLVQAEDLRQAELRVLELAREVEQLRELLASVAPHERNLGLAPKDEPR